MRLTPWALAFALLLAAGHAQAADPPPAPSCIDVEVNGQRVPAYDCLSSKLAPAAPRDTRDAPLPSAQIATRPSNEIGLFNRAATGQRMGNTFGTSVHPQRPPAAVPVSPVIKRP